MSNRVGYYDEFPPKHMNVSVKPIDVPDDSGGTIRKRILVVTKDVQAGELIYKVTHRVRRLRYNALQINSTSSGTTSRGRS